MKKLLSMFIIIFFVISHFSIIIIADKSSSDIIYVGSSILSQFSKIQDAIDFSSNGDTIFVNQGYYQENIILDKSIILIGENKNNTIIDGNGTGDVVLIQDSGVEINGFTIKNSGNSGRNSGIKVFGDYVIIRNNNILDNTIGIFIGDSYGCNIEFNDIYSNRDSGIHLLRTHENNIESNQIYENRWGIFSTQSFNNTINNNLIELNKIYGIWLLRHNFGNIISNNSIKINGEHGIYMLLFSSFNQIYRNYIESNNEVGINIGNYWPCDGNSLIENTIIQNKKKGIFIQDSTGIIITRNNFIDNEIDASFNNCYETVWDYNYWNEARNFPKIIKGKQRFLPWLNFDLNPTSEPYNFSNERFLKQVNSNFLRDYNKTNIQNLPSSYHWNNVDGIDYTTEVKNQNPAPTCEAYALCVSLETKAQYQIGYPYDCDLSEAHLFFNSGGTCDWGVDIQESVEYLIYQGIPDEGCYPDPHRPYDHHYESVTGWENRSIKIKEWGWVEKEEESIKQALIEYGPLVICQMTRKDLDYYKSGIYMPRISSPIQRGHVVAIIGYDDNERYWTVRNSGGSSWGEEGHFRISYDAFDSYYSFIYPFYGGTGILYIDGIYGNLKPDIPKIEIINPKFFHTYLFNYETNSIFRQIDNIQRGAPRIFGSITISINASNANKVDFMVDGIIQYVDNEEPFEWEYEGSEGLHTIETIAYNENAISKDIIDIYIIK